MCHIHARNVTSVQSFVLVLRLTAVVATVVAEKVAWGATVWHADGYLQFLHKIVRALKSEKVHSAYGLINRERFHF